jgi:virginiamycin B lyase
MLAAVVEATPSITENTVDPGNSFHRGIYDIATGSDGALWFTEENTQQIGRITTTGQINEYSIPDNATPSGITPGPDGALWFDEYSRNKIGRIATDGSVTDFPIPYDGSPSDITTGPDGALWFTEMSASGDAIGRMTTSGQFNMYTVPTTTDQDMDITAGPDNSLWFTELYSNKIGRITTSGVITEYSIPTSNSDPQGITLGPDGALWFTEDTANQIGQITTSGNITEFALPASNDTFPVRITSGPDGALWFTIEGNNNIGSIGRITTSGTVSEYSITTTNPAPTAITTGPDGALWFTEFGSNKIGRITTPPPILSAPNNLTAPSPTNLSPSLSWDADSGASSYNIYRNGTKIDSTTSTSYTDSSLTSDGSYSYTITAVNSSGESDQSSPASVVYDTTPPAVTIAGAANGETYAANNAPTPVCDTSDSLSGVAANAILTVFNSGNSYTATCSGATDNAGNVAYNTGVTYTVLQANYTLVNLGDSNNTPLSNAKVTLTNSAGTVTTLTTDNFGNAYLNTAPGTYKVTAYYANGYQSQNITVTNNGPNNVTFATVPVTVTINDPNSTDLANAKVAQAGNTGTFGSKAAVDSNGQVTFQVLPGTSYFTAYVANGYQTQSLNVTTNGSSAVAFNTDAVQVTVTKNSNPLPTATVKQAGNSGTFGSSQNVDANGQYTFYVLPGTNYVEAFDGPNNYTKQTLNVTGDISIILAVQ